jgi:hypothetical protein
MQNSASDDTATANRNTTTFGISSSERIPTLLDDLRVEIARLANAVERLADGVERQNGLLAERREVER